jgi:hypothetical protein
VGLFWDCPSFRFPHNWYPDWPVKSADGHFRCWTDVLKTIGL